MQIQVAPNELAGQVQKKQARFEVSECMKLRKYKLMKCAMMSC